jgi:type VI protein secretion system component VasK
VAGCQEPPSDRAALESHSTSEKSRGSVCLSVCLLAVWLCVSVCVSVCVWVSVSGTMPLRHGNHASVSTVARLIQHTLVFISEQISKSHFVCVRARMHRERERRRERERESQKQTNNVHHHP